MFNEETLAKLTTNLSGEIDLYNAVISEMQETEEEAKNYKTQLEEKTTKLDEAEKRGQAYLEQISNLLSKIPVSTAPNSQSHSQKIEEIKSKPWTK